MNKYKCGDRNANDGNEGYYHDEDLAENSHSLRVSIFVDAKQGDDSCWQETLGYDPSPGKVVFWP